MRQLFPSSSSLPKRPRLSEAFDPTQPCIALQQKSKKKAARVKPSKVSVVVVQDVSKGVPKGKYYKELKQSECVGKVELTRVMSVTQVKSAITRTFSHLPLEAFTYLECTNKVILSINPDQNQDGNKIITSSQTSKGPLYVLRCIQSTNLQSQVTSAISEGTINVSLYFISYLPACHIPV